MYFVFWQVLRGDLWKCSLLSSKICVYIVWKICIQRDTMLHWKLIFTYILRAFAYFYSISKTFIWTQTWKLFASFCRFQFKLDTTESSKYLRVNVFSCFKTITKSIRKTCLRCLFGRKPIDVLLQKGFENQNVNYLTVSNLIES